MIRTTLAVLALAVSFSVVGAGTAFADETVQRTYDTVRDNAPASSWGIVAESLNTGGSFCPPQVVCSTSWS